MNWMQRLCETYECCVCSPRFDKDAPLPVGHIRQQAHIEVVLSSDGNFLRAAVVPKAETIIPATEESAGRTRKAVPHPLCDKIQYCAGDYRQFGGEKDFAYPAYLKQLGEWSAFASNARLSAVFSYVGRSSLVGDLVNAGILCSGADGKLLTAPPPGAPAPEIFRHLTPDLNTRQRDQGSAFVRWVVHIPGDEISAVWEDRALQESWIRFQESRDSVRGMCMVSGEVVALAVNHPKKIRHSGDGAKLLSSNDVTGYTFRGRFENSGQAYSVGSTVSQKAHNALRWLIDRRAFKSANQVYVAWAKGGAGVPDPLASSADLFEAAPVRTPAPAWRDSDIEQQLALRLKSAMAGYSAGMDDSETIAVLGLNSATPGRLAITCYREMTAPEFLDRVASWHSSAAWHQDLGRDRRFVGAPSPKDIAEAAYGRRVDENLRMATVERLLPCILDGRPLPRDLVNAAARRACNRAGVLEQDWKSTLGVACALVRRSREKEAYRMALEEDRNSRDYLYGRLLAIAENIEERALHVVKEKRDTTAARLMQRFSMRPCSTWRNMELALVPYKGHLRSHRPAVLAAHEKLLDSVIGMFRTGDFLDDRPLSGEFLLGYHCQRAALADGLPNYPGAEVQYRAAKNGATV